MQQISKPGERRRSAKEITSDHASQSQGEGKSQGESQGSSTRKTTGYETPGSATAAGPRGGRRGVRMRPAARGADPLDHAWDRGEVMPLAQVEISKFKPGSLVVSEEAEYYGSKSKVKIAGLIRSIESGMEETYLTLGLTGTDSEDLLKVYTASPHTPFRLHLCKRHCDKMESGDRILHASKGRQGQGEGEEPWTKSLEGVGMGAAPGGPMERLRERSTGLPHPLPPVRNSPSPQPKTRVPKTRRRKRRKRRTRKMPKRTPPRSTSTEDTRAELLKKTIKLSTQEQHWT